MRRFPASAQPFVSLDRGVDRRTRAVRREPVGGAGRADLAGPTTLIFGSSDEHVEELREGRRPRRALPTTPPRRLLAEAPRQQHGRLRGPGLIRPEAAHEELSFLS